MVQSGKPESTKSRKRSRGIRREVVNQNLRVVHFAKLVVMDVLVAELRGQMIERLIGLLADGLVHLHLQDQMRAALQVQAQLDARE